MSVYYTKSPAETLMLGKKLAEELKGGEVIALKGGLGMGKTCFSEGIARGLGYTGETSSPTFALINEYSGGRLTMYHFDMYRVESFEDLYSTGFFDYLDMGGVLVVEWSENITSYLPENTITITIEQDGETGRKFTVTGETA